MKARRKAFKTPVTYTPQMILDTEMSQNMQFNRKSMDGYLTKTANPQNNPSHILTTQGHKDIFNEKLSASLSHVRKVRKIVITSSKYTLVILT